MIDAAEGIGSPAARDTRRAGGLIIAFCLIAVFSGACASRRIALPTDAGSPLTDYSDVHAQVSAGCRDVRTLTAEMGLRGRAAGRRISGRVVAGFEQPSSMRLEGVAPFGPPGFILAARGDTAVLLLPRDDRFVKGASSSDLLGALTGVTLAPADLQAIVTGCAVPAPTAIGGRLHANGWASIDLEGGATLYLRRSGTWQVLAARRSGWIVDYSMWAGRFPGTIRLRSESGPQIEMTATLSQVEANIDIDPSAFTVTVPPSAAPLSLDELRAAGPLGETE